jgi:hypothetical protein
VHAQKEGLRKTEREREGEREQHHNKNIYNMFKEKFQFNSNLLDNIPTIPFMINFPKIIQKFQIVEGEIMPVTCTLKLACKVSRSSM